MNKLCFKAFGKTLIDIMRAKNEDNVERPFGEWESFGVGRWFQTNFVVVKKGLRFDIVRISLYYYDLWQHYTVLKLQKKKWD